MLKKSILITLIFVVILVGIYGVIRWFTIGQMEHIEIDKSDENLGIKKSPELLAAIERAKNFEEQQKDKKAIVELEKTNEPSLFHILLLGVDSRSKNDKGSRSDAIMLLTIDFKNKDIKLGSFIRDTQVEIKGRKDKINHAYAYGGGEETLRVLNSNFDLDIRDFAVVNMFDLREIIDTIGGLDIEITEAERREINYRVKEIANVERRTDYELVKESGLKHLNGEQVVAYGRIRNTAGGDFKRTDRQREVIELIINKMKSKNVVELVDIANNLFPLISTTLSTSEVESLVLKTVSQGINYTIHSTRFPSDEVSQSDMSTGVYYLKIKDLDKCIEEIHGFVYGSNGKF